MVPKAVSGKVGVGTGASSVPVLLCQCLVCMLSVSNLSSASAPVLATSFPINS